MKVLVIHNALYYKSCPALEDDAKVKRAFQTLRTYMGNVSKNPDEEKFRKIRLTNQTFQDRAGSLKGGIEFVELCGFEKMEGEDVLVLTKVH
ncbi:hypothetical protein YC2023_121450 [Brassica napus]|uniref:(rape) hypothetical protein n=1 Tax=Brassica napus TaxID=3708 RepID=A0A817B191_BRANA|nr:unnamed protein product [Brassica napus]